LNPTTATTPEQLQQFVYALKNTESPASPGGYNGVSFWACEFQTASIWNAMPDIQIGESQAGTLPKMVTPKRNASTFSVSAATEAGREYTLEYMTSGGSVWTPCQTVTGTGTVVVFTDPDANDSYRIYRIKMR
jgi:hypothetical protein